MSDAPPFGFVPIEPRRSLSKPRTTGLTMVVDDGLPLPYMRGILELAAPYIDLMKIKTGTARLYPRDKLVEKLALYEGFGIQPFLGGQFHEYVFATMGDAALPKFYAESRALGFRTIEISDNTVPLNDTQRREQIKAAIASGLDVFGEVGSKETLSNPGLLIEQADICLEAGAKLVLVEAAELVEHGRVRKDSLEVIKRGIPADKVMIELPGAWISGVRSCDIEEMKKILFAEFGPDVNLANVAVTTIYDTEAQRVGLGTGGPLQD
jgi:phosphosulfolactate synthase